MQFARLLLEDTRMDGNSPALQAAMAALTLWVGRSPCHSAHWRAAVFGVRVRGAIHFLHLQAAHNLRSPWSGWRRDWRQEPMPVESLKHIQANDEQLAYCVDTIFAELSLQADHFDQVGTIHAGFAPQNFRYDSELALHATMVIQ
jgi:hypothetical protein